MNEDMPGRNVPLYNSRIVRNYIRLLASRYKHIETNRLLQDAGMELYQVEDDGHWFTQTQINLFHARLSSLTHANISREAGSYTASTDSLGLMRQYFLSLMGLAAVYEHMGSWSRKFSRSCTYRTKKLAANKVEITVSPNPGVREEPFQCQNRLGFLEGFSRLFNVMPPKVEHPECLFNRGSACRYIVSWEEGPAGRLVKMRNVLFLVLAAVCVLSFLLVSTPTALTVVLPAALITGLAAGWLAELLRTRELQNSMAQISASADEQMEQISANYDNSLLINEVGQALNSKEDIKGVLEDVASIMQKRLAYDRGLILLVNSNGTKLLFHAGYGYTRQQEEFLLAADFHLHDPEGKSIFAQTFSEKTPQLINDPANDPAGRDCLYGKEMKSRTIISCPVLHEKEVLGVLTVDNIERKGPHYQRDLNLLMGISSQVGARIHNIMLQKRLRQTQKMEAVGSLAGGVAHDFNNILTTILGYCQLLLFKLPEKDPLRDHVESIFLAGERAARLTRQLLAFSRNQVMEMKVINLNDIVGEMAKMLKRLIGENVAMKLQLSESDGNILADPGQIEQILLNLAVNARDAMEAGGTLFIETSKTVVAAEDKLPDKMRAGSYVLLRVSDTGEGMNENIRDRIFEPFFTTKSADRGTGLGLSTVYGIVKQHKGYINVDSEVGSGTTFTIYFPLVDTEVQKKVRRQIKKPAPATETLLVVDDDPTLLKMVGDILEPLGYRVLAAASGAEALELNRTTQGKIDLLLTDVVMPGMNGRQLIKIMQQNRPGLKAVLMSGYPADIVSQDKINGNNFIFLSKPFTPIGLSDKIKLALAGG